MAPGTPNCAARIRLLVFCDIHLAGALNLMLLTSNVVGFSAAEIEPTSKAIIINTDFINTLVV